MKTLADFKRDVTSGKIKLEIIERYGETGDEIPARCRGIRTVKSVNTVGIMLETADGLTSSLAFPPAKLIEYDGKSLTIYERGERDLTEQEKKILADWPRVTQQAAESWCLYPQLPPALRARMLFAQFCCFYFIEKIQ